MNVTALVEFKRLSLGEVKIVAEIGMPRRLADQFRQQSKNLGVRLVTLYLLLLLIPVAGIGIYGHVYLQGTLAENTLRYERETLTVRAATIDAMLRLVHDDIVYLTQRVESAQPRDPTDELIALAASHPMYRSIGWMTLGGEVLGGHPSEALRLWLAQAAPQIDTFTPYSIRFFPWSPQDESEKTYLIAAARLDTSILLIEIEAGELLQNVVSESDEEHWALVIASENFLTTTDDPAHFAEIIPNLSAETGGYVTMNDRIHFYSPTGPGGSWTLLESVPRESVTVDLSSYYLTFFVMLTGGLTSVIGLALFAIARIIDPVYQLEQMVDAMRHGEARPALPEKLPTDEFGKLMLAFDHMAAELEQKRRTERALIEQLIRAQEEERKLIAYDLHDGLIQQLVGARLYLGQCRSEWVGRADEDGKANNFKRGYDVLTEAIAEGRRIIQGLHPTVLEDLGLEAALRELVTTMAENAGWNANARIDTLAVQPDRSTSVTLYRITQEALNNTFKHANAKNVCVRLRVWKNHIFLFIRDDGCGFDAATVLRNGGQRWGIKTMHERATMLQGACKINSKPGKGTRLIVQTPYQPEDIAT